MEQLSKSDYDGSGFPGAFEVITSGARGWGGAPAQLGLRRFISRAARLTASYISLANAPSESRPPVIPAISRSEMIPSFRVINALRRGAPTIPPYLIFIPVQIIHHPFRSHSHLRGLTG